MRSLTHLYLDIETLPVPADDPAWVEYVDTVPAVAAAIAALAELRDAPVLPAGNLTNPDKIAASIAERTAKRADDIAAAERAIVDARESARLATSLDPLWGRVACVGVALGADDDPCVLDGAPGSMFGTRAAESALLVQVAHVLRDERPWTIYGWNVQGFDLPFLRARAIITGCVELRDALPSVLAKPWEQPVRDLMLLWPSTGHGGRSYTRQTHAARALGLPRQAFDGRDVAPAFERGDFAAIVEHCLADVAELVVIAERMGLA